MEIRECKKKKKRDESENTTMSDPTLGNSKHAADYDLRDLDLVAEWSVTVRHTSVSYSSVIYVTARICQITRIKNKNNKNVSWTKFNFNVASISYTYRVLLVAIVLGKMHGRA